MSSMVRFLSPILFFPLENGTFLNCPLLYPHHLGMKSRGLPIPFTDLDDTPIWGATTSGEFSTKSATWLAHGSNKLPQKWHHSWIWKFYIPPKIAIYFGKFIIIASQSGTFFINGISSPLMCVLFVIHIMKH